MNFLKNFGYKSLGFISLLVLLVLAGCGKQDNGLSRDENLQVEIENRLESFARKYKSEFKVLNLDKKEKVKIKKIGKIVGAIRYKTKWSERWFGREFSGNNIPFHRYNDLLNKDISKTKKLIRSIRWVKNLDDFYELKKELDILLIKLKDIYFLVTRHKDYRNESRYKQNILNQQETQRRIDYLKYKK